MEESSKPDGSVWTNGETSFVEVDNGSQGYFGAKELAGGTGHRVPSYEAGNDQEGKSSVLAGHEHGETRRDESCVGG